MRFPNCLCGANKWGHPDPEAETVGSARQRCHHCGACERPGLHIYTAEKNGPAAFIIPDSPVGNIDWSYAEQIVAGWGKQAIWLPPPNADGQVIYRGNDAEEWEQVTAEGVAEKAVA